jgi:hypothetical protein
MGLKEKIPSLFSREGDPEVKGEIIDIRTYKYSSNKVGTYETKETKKYRYESLYIKLKAYRFKFV